MFSLLQQKLHRHLKKLHFFKKKNLPTWVPVATSGHPLAQGAEDYGVASQSAVGRLTQECGDRSSLLNRHIAAAERSTTYNTTVGQHYCVVEKVSSS